MPNINIIAPVVHIRDYAKYNIIAPVVHIFNLFIYFIYWSQAIFLKDINVSRYISESYKCVKVYSWKL